MRVRRSFVPAMLLAMVGIWSGQVLAASPAASPSHQGLPSPSTSGQPGSIAFVTPEDAVRAYLAGVAGASTAGLLGASAIAELAAGYRFDLNAERLGVFSFPTDLAPAEYPFFADVDQARQAARILGQVQLLAYSLLSSEPIDESPVVPVDKARVEAFARSVDPARLSGLSVVDVRFPDATFAHNAKYLANAAARAAVYGADELTERLALVSFEGNLYEIGFTLVRYGDDWKVLTQSSALANTSGLGTAKPTTLEEFDRQTEGS